MTTTPRRAVHDDLAPQTPRDVAVDTRVRQMSATGSRSALSAVLAIPCTRHGAEAGRSCWPLFSAIGAHATACGHRQRRALAGGR